MKRLIIVTFFLSSGFCQGIVLADDAVKNIAAQGNQGYVYGVPARAADVSASSADAKEAHGHLVGDIFAAVKKLNDWFEDKIW